MAKFNFRKSSQSVFAIAAAALSVAMIAAPVSAQTVVVEATNGNRTIIGEEYTPTIWVDPDGCEHWVFDDGFEGFMSPHRNRDGSPVCRRQEVCGVVPSDTLFANDEAWIAEGRKSQLMSYFANLDAYGVMIYGHTDANASDEYNMGLSQRRADMVANVARSAGVNVVEARGFGERRPAQAGNSAAAYAANRRVEVICLK
ncbi:outer membrane protein OmpA-like peptidoglycan-associated protein [Loktanella ponticola]|uniref:Outer membrane protein OmpA-like peptidoglycan-associated protein n=1 Tax=Yoonia ponticola TaxID=1524255 RepID=A0A7W9EZC1_9RHOB|nr:outer membrane protein OmpA-like peptidoglycan-associated protein [Yoonia ponticola]